MKNSIFALIAFLGVMFFAATSLPAQVKNGCCGDNKSMNSCCTQSPTCKETCKTGNCNGTDCKKETCESGNCLGMNCCKNESGSKTDDPKKDAVTGETIPDGKAIEFSYLGKTYYFLNESNLATFKSEPIDYAKDLKCPVMGDEASKEYSTEYNGVKYYVCCPPCLKKVNKNPEKYLNPEKKN